MMIALRSRSPGCIGASAMVRYTFPRGMGREGAGDLCSKQGNTEHGSLQLTRPTATACRTSRERAVPWTRFRTQPITLSEPFAKEFCVMTMRRLVSSRCQRVHSAAQVLIHRDAARVSRNHCGRLQGGRSVGVQSSSGMFFDAPAGRHYWRLQ
jgi:hypothetical protein